MDNLDYTKIRILIVDDEPDILEFLEYNLSKEGFQIMKANDGFQAIEIAKDFLPHLILLDIMMPNMDGVETCYKLRASPSFNKTMIAFLTARHEEYSQIAGLEAGADDYIQKPIRPRLLVTRVKALLRRHEEVVEEESNNILHIGSLKIDKESYEVHENSERIELAKKEFDILWLLASKPGKVFSREEIYRTVWGNNVIVGNRTIDVHISKLREKLGDAHIKTVKGVGYKIDS